jgi:hypothetical protein
MRCSSGVAVVDLDTFDALREYTWSMNGDCDYPICGGTYMHRIVMDNTAVPRGALSVDHVNWIKPDNRRANLREATQGEQNQNRFTRADKGAVRAELTQAGIERLPRGIRWDNTAGRYTCSDHSACKGKPCNGTRHGDSDEVAKFKDCLDVYIANLEADDHFRAEHALGAVRARMAEEYNAIVRSAHVFDASMPDGPYAMIDDIVDDLTHAKRIMATLGEVRVTKGAANMDWREVVAPNGLVGAIGRIKGPTLTLYDERFRTRLEGLNWDVEGGAPRAIAALVWSELAGKAIPAGHVVGAISRRAFDVRLENLELVVGRQGYRGTDDDWIVPDGIGPVIGMRFLPKGVTVNASKVMISKAGRLHPGEHGANANGMWSKTRSTSRDAANTTKLVCDAIECLKKTHGVDEFDASNATYQRLLGEYLDARQAIMG